MRPQHGLQGLTMLGILSNMDWLDEALWWMPTPQGLDEHLWYDACAEVVELVGDPIRPPQFHRLRRILESINLRVGCTGSMSSNP